MLSNLLRPEVQQFIRDHERDDISQLALKGSPFEDIPAPRLFDQIIGRAKAKTKLPAFYRSSNLIYPPGLNLEQSSSEQTAKFKAGIISNAQHVMDLTGGFGIDSFYLSQVSASLDYIESNMALLEIARHNHQELGAKNIVHHNSSAENFLATSRHVDLIYIDPSRRVAQQKVFTLEDCEPNVVALQSEILERSPRLLIKAAPLLDIKLALRQLHSVKEVYVVAVDNEVKELLFFLERGFVGEPSIQAVNLKGESVETVSFTFFEEESVHVEYAPPGKYLYEPNAAILKAGAFKSISRIYGIGKLHVSTHLYTSAELVGEFPGRVFEVTGFVKPEKKDVARQISSGKANVISRNHPLKAEELKLRVGITDGGDQYLIAFTGPRKKYVAVANRIK